MTKHKLWTVHFEVPREHSDFFSEAVGAEGLAVTTGETKDANHWYVELLCNHEPEHQNWNTRLTHLSEVAGIKAPQAEITMVEDKDWIAETMRRFPSFPVGRFLVHGSHIKVDAAQGVIPILVDAGRAFGTGEHQTTQGCLTFIDQLATKGETPKQILDMGCGSAILAIAAAKCWPTAKVLGADNDAPSVDVAQENCRINQVPHVVIVHSEGFGRDIVQKTGPYNLVLANILARPLIEMAPYMVKSMHPGAYAVLSGLLAEQADEVSATYAKEGMKELDRVNIENWIALLMRKSG